MQLFKRANTFAALLAFFFRRSGYVSMAVEHGMAINLEAADLAAAYQQGTFPKQGWQAEATTRAFKHAQEMQKALIDTLLMAASATAIALILLAIAGKISPELPLACSKVFGTIGVFLAGWAALFELAGVPRTWSGESLHELVHPMIFCALFLPGLIMTLVAQLW